MKLKKVLGAVTFRTEASKALFSKAEPYPHLGFTPTNENLLEKRLTIWFTFQTGFLQF